MLLFEIQRMSHTVFLCLQIAFVVFVRSGLDVYVFYHRKSVRFQADTLHRIVGDEAHLADTDGTEDFGAYSVITFIGLMALAEVGIHCIHSVFLQLVSLHLFHQADTAAFLVQVNNGSLTFFLNHLECLVELFATITAH